MRKRPPNSLVCLFVDALHLFTWCIGIFLLDTYPITDPLAVELRYPNTSGESPWAKEIGEIWSLQVSFLGAWGQAYIFFESTEKVFTDTGIKKNKCINCYQGVNNSSINFCNIFSKHIAILRSIELYIQSDTPAFSSWLRLRLGKIAVNMERFGGCIAHCCFLRASVFWILFGERQDSLDAKKKKLYFLAI